MDDDNNNSNSNSNPSSVKHKLRNSLCFFSCCFGRRHSNLLPPTDDNPALIWVRRTKGADHSFSQIKQKWRSFWGNNNNKRQSSADFGYDPLSYALNFEDGFEDDDGDDGAPLKNFTARLPASPPLTAAVK